MSGHSANERAQIISSIVRYILPFANLMPVLNAINQSGLAVISLLKGIHYFSLNIMGS